MDDTKYREELTAQIRRCEETIQQNVGVIQYCRFKLAELDAPKPADNGGEQK